jgi:hypothetical protein
VVLIGIAQEKAPAWRSWKAKGQEHAAHPHMEWGRQMAFINHFYFYVWDPDWGGAFWKTNAYVPYPIWIWLNAHTWAQRQCERAGLIPAGVCVVRSRWAPAVREQIPPGVCCESRALR